MNRLVLLLAASTLGTGCVVSDTCDFRTVSIGWSSFELADGTVTASCTAAGASTVNVYMDDKPAGSLSCTTGGVNVTGVPAGNHLFTVEAVDSGGNIILRDEFNTSGNGCGTLLADTRPAEGTFRLDYSFTPTNVCTTGGSYIWFSILDQIAGRVTVAVDETSANPSLYTCGSTISFALPKGSYTLQRTEEVTFNGSYHAAATDCTGASFDIAAAALTPVPSAMVDSSTFCP